MSLVEVGQVRRGPSGNTYRIASIAAGRATLRLEPDPGIVGLGDSVAIGDVEFEASLRDLQNWSEVDADGDRRRRQWELDQDRNLDLLTDEQLRYLISAALVTLDDRGCGWFALMNGATSGGWRVTTRAAWHGPHSYEDACAIAKNGGPSS